MRNNPIKREGRINIKAHIIDAMGGGLCEKHGEYYGHGKYNLRDCPRCDIDEYYKTSDNQKCTNCGANPCLEVCDGSDKGDEK